MSPSTAFLLGLIGIWIVANGRAGKLWEAITGVQPSTNVPGIAPGTPSPGGSLPNIPPGNAGSPGYPGSA